MPNDLRAWRVAALPATAVLGIALPLTFASHCEQYLYDFRAIDLLPLYATAWLILAAAVAPCWIVLTAALKGCEALPLRRPLGSYLAAAIRLILFALTAAIIVATLIGCLRIWLHTLHGALPLSADGALGLAVLAGVLAAITAQGRAAMRAVMPVAAICTAAGLLSLASLPAFGWHRGSIEKAPPAAADTALPVQPPADPGQAQPMHTATPPAVSS
ncbi:MAG TPA: hypothetical protein VGG96_09815, partial [Steroidobacteraceae bacterium]